MSSDIQHTIRLDALAAILPEARAHNLASVLTDDDVETLQHLVREGMGENSIRALASDLAYLQSWAIIATGEPLPWPAPESLILKFISHHLWDPGEKERNENHGMPNDVYDRLHALGQIRVNGPHAPSTVQRRLASWSTLHRWNNVKGRFRIPSVQTALRLAVRSSQHQPQHKSKTAIDRQAFEKLLATCGRTKLADIRDRAILYTAMASGGRRRSEVAGLRLSQIKLEEPLDDKETSEKLLCMSIALGRTKTSARQDMKSVYMVGQPVQSILDWLKASGIKDGAVFRHIDRWNNVKPFALSGDAINAIVKKRASLAGLDPATISAHGLRSGFITEAARAGIPLIDIMPQTGHKSVSMVARYYENADGKTRRSARLFS